jgi:hypothetical protein
MSYITSIVKRLFPKEVPKLLGRWRIETVQKQMDNKIDLSNEDHCGPCGQYVLEKNRCVKSKNENMHLK